IAIARIPALHFLQHIVARDQFDPRRYGKQLLSVQCFVMLFVQQIGPIRKPDGGDFGLIC
ncbi:MAG: hypothetical protein AAGA21_22975, partial [Pseudomonadota bacterium]